jgi:hypothetical protein
MAKMKWLVEFEVDEIWVADGFDMTDQGALDMLSSVLGYANIGTELDARIIAGPSAKRVANAQGYRVCDVIKKQRADNKIKHYTENPLIGIKRVLQNALRKLDSVAFLSREGDTDEIKSDIFQAIRKISTGLQPTDEN